MKAKALIAALVLAAVIAGAAILWSGPDIAPDLTDASAAECNVCTARHKGMLRNRAQP